MIDRYLDILMNRLIDVFEMAGTEKSQRDGAGDDAECQEHCLWGRGGREKGHGSCQEVLHSFIL